eukprot:2636724-Pyramimonas_sp.AAC.1
MLKEWSSRWVVPARSDEPHPLDWDVSHAEPLPQFTDDDVKAEFRAHRRLADPYSFPAHGYWMSKANRSATLFRTPVVPPQAPRRCKMGTHSTRHFLLGRLIGDLVR